MLTELDLNAIFTQSILYLQYEQGVCLEVKPTDVVNILDAYPAFYSKCPETVTQSQPITVMHAAVIYCGHGVL